MINFKVHYRYADGVELTCEQTPTSAPSITYFGSDAWIKIDGYPGVMTSSKPELLTREPEAGELDFAKTLWDKNDLIAAIRDGRQPLEPIEVGHRAITIAQIGLIACQVQGQATLEPREGEIRGQQLRQRPAGGAAGQAAVAVRMIASRLKWGQLTYLAKEYCIEVEF